MNNCETNENHNISVNWENIRQLSNNLGSNVIILFQVQEDEKWIRKMLICLLIKHAVTTSILSVSIC